jgi:ketosteroid isomerase-like protein
MEKALIMFALFCTALPVATPQTVSSSPEQPASADRESIRQIPEDWIRFYNAGDAAKVAAVYTEDGYYLSAHILAHGRPAIPAYWERGIKADGHIDFI